MIEFLIFAVIVCILLYIYTKKTKASQKNQYLSLGSYVAFGIVVTPNLNDLFWHTRFSEHVLCWQRLTLPKEIIPPNTKVGNWFKLDMSATNTVERKLTSYFVVSNENDVFGISFTPNCGLDIYENFIKTFTMTINGTARGTILIKVKSNLEKYPIYLCAIGAHWEGSFTDPNNVTLVQEVMNYVKNEPCILMGEFNMENSFVSSKFNQQVHPKNKTVSFEEKGKNGKTLNIIYAMYNNVSCVDEGIYVPNAQSHFFLKKQLAKYVIETKKINIITDV